MDRDAEDIQEPQEEDYGIDIQEEVLEDTVDPTEVSENIENQESISSAQAGTGIPADEEEIDDTEDVESGDVFSDPILARRSSDLEIIERESSEITLKEQEIEDALLDQRLRDQGLLWENDGDGQEEEEDEGEDPIDRSADPTNAGDQATEGFSDGDHDFGADVNDGGDHGDEPDIDDDDVDSVDDLIDAIIGPEGNQDPDRNINVDTDTASRIFFQSGDSDVAQISPDSHVYTDESPHISTGSRVHVDSTDGSHRGTAKYGGYLSNYFFYWITLIILTQQY